jgi:hypothetical protein
VLPAVEERLGEATPALLFQTGEQRAWDNIAVWRIEYRCEYRDGQIDRRLHERAIIAATRPKAIGILQRMHAGFGVARILLYEVRGPLTPAQIAELKEINERKPWMETADERG